MPSRTDEQHASDAAEAIEAGAAANEARASEEGEVAVKAGPSSGEEPGAAAAAVKKEGEPSDVRKGRRNPRLERLKAALDKFLELIDHRANSANIASALPRIDAGVLEDARVQFVQELKDVIKAENESLIEVYGLGPRLGELQQLAQEADERNRAGLQPGCEELRDVWRPDLDIATATYARALPGQRERVQAMELELAELQTSNAQKAAELKMRTADAERRQVEARGVLDLLDETITALDSSPETDTALRSTLDALLAELGARR